MKKIRGKLVRDVLLSQDNAPARTSIVAMDAATKYSFGIPPHHPYSSDLAPSDLYLFPNLKANLRSRNFGSNIGVIDAVNECLENKEEDIYFEGISKLEKVLRGNGRFCREIMAQFLLLVTPKVEGLKTFLLSLV